MKLAEGSRRVLITCPPEVRRWLEESAVFNSSTMSAEAVRAMRAQRRAQNIFPSKEKIGPPASKARAIPLLISKLSGC